MVGADHLQYGQKPALIYFCASSHLLGQPRYTISGAAPVVSYSADLFISRFLLKNYFFTVLRFFFISLILWDSNNFK